MKLHRIWLVAIALVALLAAGCGDDGDEPGDPAGDSDTSDEGGDDQSTGDEPDAGDDDAADDETAVDEPAGDDGGGSAGSGGGGGTLVLGDETIALDSARCFLEEQDAAGGGGKILFVAQGFGTNAAGDELVVDLSRYDEESQFTGDDILVDIGDPFSDDAVSLSASGDIGTIVIDGSTLSASGLTFDNFDDGSQTPGSVQVNC